MNKKYVSLSLAALMCVSSVTPVFAYELDTAGNSIENIEYQNSKDEDFANETNVFAELGSEYKVTIPKVIVLSGTTKKADYYVKVEGDIAGYETIEVIPDEEVELFTKNKDSQTGVITQDKITWKYDNFDINANGEVSAQDLTAGKWSGTFNFNINLKNTVNDVVDEIVTLPAKGTKLSEMSFSEIKEIAAAGKTADYNIKLGDEIKVNDSVNAQVIEIGEDYIEFATTSKVVNYDRTSSQVIYVNDEDILISNASFYKTPQVNNGRTNRTTIGYYNSNIRNEIYDWFIEQSEEFQNSIKNTVKTYEKATLAYDGKFYSQTTDNEITIIEQVYIPSIKDLESGKFAINPIYNNNAFWTSTPSDFSFDGNHYYSFGVFCNSRNIDYNGNMNEGAIAVFRIG